MKYGIALKIKEYVTGLTKEETVNLFEILEINEAFPIELEAKNADLIAIGFITPPAAKNFEYEYKSSGLADFIALILDNSLFDKTSNEYVFRGVKIYIS